MDCQTELKEARAASERFKRENDELHEQQRHDRARLTALQSDYDVAWQELHSLKCECACACAQCACAAVRDLFTDD